MGLDISIISQEFLSPPPGRAYEFAWRLAEEGVDDAYATGMGRVWAPFTQRQVLRLLDEFTREQGLSPEERQEIRSWIESLPWHGWRDALAPHPPTDPEEEDERQHGGLIELHFDW